VRLDATTSEIVLFLLNRGFWVNHPIEAQVGDEQAHIALQGGRYAIVTRKDDMLHAEYEKA
jgi:hypothetical protein